MLSVIVFVLTLFAGIGCAAVQPAAAAKNSAPLSRESSIDDVLDALDQVGKELKEFSANVKLTETQNDTAMASTRSGKIWYRAGDDEPRMRVAFDTKEDDTRTYNEKVEYALEKGWLIDRDYKRRSEVRRQVAPPGEKVNLLKLGEGPFPLPIGQKKEDVHKLFEVQKAEPAENDPPGTIHLSLKPKEGTRLAKKFNVVELWVDEQNHMLRKIEATDSNESTTRTTEFSGMKINPEPALRDADLSPPPIDQQEWDLHEEPFEE